jgi:hypothetical protein
MDKPIHSMPELIDEMAENLRVFWKDKTTLAPKGECLHT